MLVAQPPREQLPHPRLAQSRLHDLEVPVQLVAELAGFARSLLVAVGDACAHGDAPAPRVSRLVGVGHRTAVEEAGVRNADLGFDGRHDDGREGWVWM